MKTSAIPIVLPPNHNGPRFDPPADPDHDAEAEHLKAWLRARMFGASSHTRLGRFSVLRIIGQGGMGIVYAGHDPQLDRKVAIKLLHAVDRETPEERNRLVREAQALARLSHPNVVQVYEAGTVGGQIYVVMEYVDGPTLAQWQRGRRNWRDVLKLYLQAGEGLAAAHAAGIIHRDFKPGNLLLGQDGRVRVVDFGLARTKSGEESTPTTPLTCLWESELTQTGQVVGTPAYMSPEQAMRVPIDARSDQFSYCIALFEGLFGERPHVGTTANEILHSIVNGDMKPFPGRPRIPQRIIQVIRRGLSLAPDDRYPDMAALLLDLKRAPRRALQQRIAVGGVLISGAIGGYLVTIGNACAHVHDDLEGVWDATVAARIAERVRTSGTAYAIETWSSVRSGLDEYTRAWVDLARRSCEAHGAIASHSDGRSTCLDARRMRLAALTGQLLRSDPALVEHAAHAVTALPSLHYCEDHEFVERQIVEAERADIEEIQTVRAGLMNAAALRTLGQHPQALEKATNLVTRARKTEYAPLVAESLYELGLAHGALEQGDQAEERLLEAADWAEASHHDEVAADAWLELIRVRGFLLLDKPASISAARRAQAAIARLGDDALRRAQWSLFSALAHHYAGDLAGAIRLHREGLQLLESASPAGGLPLIRARANLADSLTDAAEYASAREIHAECLEQLLSALGPRHPMVGDQRIRISKALIGLDERDGAREHLYIAIDILTQTYGEANIRVSKAHLALGLLEYQAGNADLALTHVHKAVAIHSDSLEPDHPDRIEPLSLRANLLHERERYDEAYADYAEVLRLRGLRAITTQHAREQIATAHANIADVLTELGRYDGAILHGESAVAEYDAWAPRNDIRIAITLHALARAERARGNKTIAHEYWQRAAAIAQANDHVELLGLIEHARAAAKSER